MKLALRSPTEKTAVINRVLGLHRAFFTGLLGEGTPAPGGRTDKYD